MKAVVVEAAGVASLVERPVATLGAADVAVRVAYANICHTDHFVVNGTHPSATLPVVPGHEFSGVIARAGADVDQGRVGQRVAVDTQLGCGSCEACLADNVGWCSNRTELGSMADGGWQEELVIPEGAAIPIPDDLSLLEGSLTEPSANAYAAVEAAQVRPTDTVVVIGPGPIGLLVLQHARLRNPRALIVAGLPSDSTRLRLARELGATATVSAPTAEAVRAILDATSGRGAEVVIQCAGSVAATALALEVAGDRGRIVIEGFSATSERAPMSPDDVVVREQRIQGVRGWSHSQFRETLQLHANGGIRLRPLVTDCYPLADFRQALQRSLDYAGGVVKVCFAVNPERRLDG